MDRWQVAKILKQILGRKRMAKLLDYITDELDKFLGKEHNVFIGIIFMDYYKEIILKMGLYMGKGYKFSNFSKLLPLMYKSKILYNSLEEFYITYKEYIDIIKEYVKNNYLWNFIYDIERFFVNNN